MRLAFLSHGDDSISYTYDPDGIRTGKTVNGTTTKYHVMNGTLLGQTQGSDAIVFLYDEKANKYGFDYNGTKYYYIFNVQGDVIGILNEAGNQIVSYTYDAWGKVLSVDGSEASTIGQLNPIRYRGYYYDTESGFYYLQSRYYDPVVRRFINCDVESAVISSPRHPTWNKNLFSYCDNNPIIRADFGGQVWQVIVFGIVVGAMTSALLESISQILNGKSFAEIDAGDVIIESLNGGLTGLLFSAGLLPADIVFGRAIINSGSAAAHTINHGSTLVDAGANAIVSGASTSIIGGTILTGKNLFSRNPLGLPTFFGPPDPTAVPISAPLLSQVVEPWQLLNPALDAARNIGTRLGGKAGLNALSSMFNKKKFRR